MIQTCPKCSKPLSKDTIFNLCQECRDRLDDEAYFTHAIATSHLREYPEFLNRSRIPRAIRSLVQSAPDPLWDYEEGFEDRFDEYC